ncbi:MAG: GGDEF domain-containing protein [Rhodospirillales bacterium]|nr:GGDEF domain-containing protein [Rhodospirillales bacterium]
MFSIFDRRKNWSLNTYLSEHVWWLLFDKDIATHIRRYRIDTISKRIALTAAVFGVFTLAWIPIDIFSFDEKHHAKFVITRLGIASLFGLIYLYARNGSHRVSVLLSLFALLFCPLILHGVGYQVFIDNNLEGLAQINSNLYAGLPYVIIAGLSLFPVVAIETLLLAIPLILWEVGMPLFYGSFSWVEAASQTWLLGLFLGVSLLNSMIQVAQLKGLMERADNDPLTGAIARRSGTNMLDFLFNVANKKDSPFALAFLDLDNFKSINDVYGHEAGDAALRQTVDVLHEKVRSGDIVIRWGGEEFLIVLPDTSIDDAKLVLERITVDWLGPRPDGTPLTASIGLAERTLENTETWKQLLDLADSRMYEAKQAGRARYV